MAYIKIPLKNTLSVPRIVTLNYFELAPAFYTRGESHDFWELVYVDSGEVYLTGGDTEHLLHRGEAIFHCPEEFHSVRCDGIHSASVFIVTFDCHSPAMRFFRQKILSVSEDSERILRLLMEECAKSFQFSKHPLIMNESAPIGGLQSIRNYMECFLISLMRTDSEQSDTGSRFFTSQEHLEGQLAQDIDGYLRAHLYESITLEQVAQEFHFGISTLCSVFKKQTGRGIQHYFLELKMDEAKRRLSDSRDTVTEISQALGFETPQYFSRMFRRYVGVCPSEFRKSPIRKIISPVSKK